MITAQELRIDNKLHYGVTIVTIKGIHTDPILKDKEYLYVDGIVGNYYCVNLNEVNPISISFEILESIQQVKNNGINYNGGTISINTQTHLVVREFMGTWNIYVRCLNDKVAEFIDAKLHELQNLYYSLTGEELIFKQ